MKKSYMIAHQYIITVFILGAGGLLFSRAETICAFISCAIAAVYFFSTRSWIKEVETALKQNDLLDEQLIQSQKLCSIGELSSGIAHEINNPLAIIHQESEWMQHLLQTEPIADLDGVRDSLCEIRRQVGRCKEIIGKLLNFARKMEPVIQEIDINRLIEEMARLVEKEANLKNIVILRNYRQDLPLVQTDLPLVRQVILNLLNNATYAVQRDGSITVATELERSDFVAIHISDTGCGIPRQSLGRIFDPFFTTKPPGEGTGLGLSICHGIIDKLGGRISVASELGKGTTFTISLPLNKKKGKG